MNNKNYWEKTRYIPKTSFDSYLAKDKKKEYNQNNVVNNPNTYSAFTKSYQKNKNAFDNDAVANSALDYLYSSNNRGKTQSFLENNGFPTAEDREYNKEYYGVQEENNRMRDLLKSKTSSILNPKLPDKSDRLFLSGFLGDEEEERNYQNGIANVNRAREELQNAFRGSIFESALNGNSTPTIQKINSTPQISHAILRNPNAKSHAKPQNNDAFLKSLNYPNGERERWEEKITSNHNDFQPNVLGIAPMGREGRMWCWIAAASMVDEYYHPESSASQQEIANQLGKNPWDGGYIEETSKLGKGSRSCTTSGFSDRISAAELTYEKIQEEMQGRHPIVLLTETGNNYSSEHYVVIVGCYISGNGKKYVIVNETREAKTKTGINGVQTHIPYEQLKGSFSTGRGKDQRVKAFYTTRPEKDSYHK